MIASERSERDALRSVQSRIAICMCVIVRMSLLPFDLKRGHLNTLITREEGEA